MLLNVAVIPCAASVAMERICWVPKTVVVVSVYVPMEEVGLSRPMVNVWLAVIVPKLQLRTWAPVEPVIAHVPGPE
ncbi:MAG: hypothetical protein WBL50_04345 [Candidatus Acidiferrum sp.]